MEMIIKNFNRGTLEVRESRCEGKPIQTRKVLRVHEDFFYVRGELLPEKTP